MKNNKAGDIEFQNAWMVGAIILLLFLVIYLVFLNNFNTSSENLANYQTCKMSVQTKIASNKLIDSIKPLADFIKVEEAVENVDVVSIFVASIKGGVIGATFGPTGILIGQIIGAVNELESQLLLHSPQLENINCITAGKTLKGNKNEILKEIADDMYYCFSQFGSCNGNPFGNDPEKYCFTCSFFAFEEDQEFNEEDLIEYLNTKLAPNENIYYSDIFAGCKSINCHQQNEANEILEGEFINYKKETPYATFFNLNFPLSPNNDCNVIFTEYTVDEIQDLCTYIYMSTDEN